MQQYHSSGKVPPSGLWLLAVGAVILGAVLGGLLFLTERILDFYIIILFPIVVSFIGKELYTTLVKVSKVRSRIIAFVFGLVAALMVFGTYHTLIYVVTFRQDMRDDVAKRGFEYSQEEFDFLLDTVLKEETGQSGVVGSVLYHAQFGKAFTTGRNRSSWLVGDILWLYWGVELLMVVTGLTYYGMKTAGIAFDESVNSWYDGEIETLGTVNWDDRPRFHEAARASDWRLMSKYMAHEDYPIPYIQVKVSHSKPESTQHYLHIEEVTQRGNLIDTTIVIDGIIRSDQLRAFKAMLPEPPDDEEEIEEADETETELEE